MSFIWGWGLVLLFIIMGKLFNFLIFNFIVCGGIIIVIYFVV